METPPRPTIAVLVADDDDRPPQLDPLLDRVTFRYATRSGLPDALRGADALLLWDFLSDALTEAFPSADRLQWVHVVAAGVDRLMFDELVASDVAVTNAHGIFDRPIAEFVLACVLATAKQLRLSHDLQSARIWRHRETATVRGSTALVVGTGGIGREIARLLSAVGISVRGAGRRARSGDPDFGEVVPSAELADHVDWADTVVVAAPLTPQTRGLIDARVLAAMRPTAQLINIGRGPMVDERALLEALRDGQIAGAALDVFVNEPLPPDSPLWDAPNLAISPHMSGDVVGWQDALARQFVDNAERWLDGRDLLNVVDKRLGYIPRSTSSTAPDHTTGNR